MGSILAIVSKAVFEKMVDKGVKVADLVATDHYLTTGKAFESLAEGGALFLVTVRPPDERLWLVAILEQPQHKADGWYAAGNQVPIADVTEAIPLLKFASGHGLAPKKGALGMSLQTPRSLTADDEALLRNLAGAPVKQTAAVPGSGWRLENRRTRTTWKAFSAAEKKQMKEFRYTIEEAEEFSGAEILAVVDEATNKQLYDLYLWPFGSGVLFVAGSGEVVADIVQHWFKARQPNQALRERMKAAYEKAKQPLAINEGVDFTPDPEETNPTPQPKPLDGTIDEQIGKWRKAAATGQPAPTTKELWEVVAKVFPARDGKRFIFRPFPLRRLFELSTSEREAIELLVNLKTPANYFGQLGLPVMVKDMARLLERGPLGSVDETIVIDGPPSATSDGRQRHPVWALVSDAFAGCRPKEAVIDLLVGGLSAEKLGLAWQDLLEPTDFGGRASYPLTLAEHEKGLDGKKIRLHNVEVVGFMTALNLKMADGHERARSLLYSPAKSAAQGMRAAMDRTFASLVLLSCLHAHAKASGQVLPPEYDAALRLVVESQALTGSEFWEATMGLLAELPLERAQAAAGGRPEFVERFPSPSGFALAIEALEKTEGMSGPYYEKVFKKIADHVGEAARPVLEASIARKHTRVAMLEKLLASFNKKKTKAQ